MAPIFHDLAERITRRGIHRLLSDLFDDPDDMLAGLKHLRHKRHEVVVLHVCTGPSWISRSRRRPCSAAWSSIPSCSPTRARCATAT